MQKEKEMKLAVQFGAGNIGRGFIGALLSRSGYRVLFVDISDSIIPELQKRGEYTVEIVGETRREETITPVSGCYPGDQLLLDAIAEAEIVTTAVGPAVLEHIAPPIAAGLKHRMQKGVSGALNIIACENMINASSRLKELVEGSLDKDVKSFIKEHVGFPDSAVDRIVPPMEKSGDILRVRVEEFSEWIVDRRGFAGSIPEIEGMQLTDTLTAFVERKLFTLNTGHAIAAYLGSLYGHRTIDQSIRDEQVRQVVRGAMEESGEVLVRRYGFDRDIHRGYIEKILRRFENPWLKDDVQRVGRQPLRKLGFDDRLIKPLRGTIEYGFPNQNLLIGIAAALYFRNEDDPQAERLRELLEISDIREVIPRVTSLKDADVLTAIENAYEDRGVEDLVRNYVRQWIRIVSMKEARDNFAQLVDEAMAGREIIVASRGKPVVRLTPVTPPTKRESSLP
ncbi:mannitol-1-phosphate 5-dehydrogenase [Marispirochaeta aestuarii]|uniref:Mannitol-1-phosphate 5-dehydrogenase n=1 Tax=Marispirochaeta aestuarii TaxID=1963862 RepID=A0A1Y1S058_9SPIO|nr:mannitol-1-phosphate 5-dehydrogenase [Marispirochaeta aestuarii]ORC35866.1 mannitol-1-phosphate 5-dehydrogenase [Marispirochaeta aestuarii]